MAIITINTTPLLEFIVNWYKAIGNSGIAIIIYCLGIYTLSSLIQEVRDDKRKKVEILRNKNKRYFD